MSCTPLLIADLHMKVDKMVTHDQSEYRIVVILVTNYQQLSSF